MNDKSRAQLHNIIDKSLEQGHVIHKTYNKKELPENKKYAAADIVGENYTGRHLADLACAAQCLYWFFFLHSKEEISNEETLLGDYFFSRFSLHLIPIDSILLIDEFSGYIKRTAASEKFEEKQYLKFLENVHEVLDD